MTNEPVLLLVLNFFISFFVIKSACRKLERRFLNACLTYDAPSLRTFNR